MSSHLPTGRSVSCLFGRGIERFKQYSFKGAVDIKAELDAVPALVSRGLHPPRVDRLDGGRWESLVGVERDMMITKYSDTICCGFCLGGLGTIQSFEADFLALYVSFVVFMCCLLSNNSATLERVMQSSLLAHAK